MVRNRRPFRKWAFTRLILERLEDRCLPSGVYNLANDWSDVANPNGAWTYEEKPGQAITSHLDNYFSGQPAWAHATLGTPGHIPVFLKALFDLSPDLPSGHVYVHNNDSANSPAGLETFPAAFAWTAPLAGSITISGSLFEGAGNRSEDWGLYDNGTLFTGGLMNGNNVSPANPFLFSSGSGGLSALTLTVNAGDVIELELQRHAGEPFGKFVGVDMSVALTSAGPSGADVAVAIDDAPDPVLAGAQLTYTISVTNNGPDPATGVTMNDVLPTGVTFVSTTPSQGTASEQNGTVTANIGNLASSGSATITLIVTPTTAGNLSNTATVSATESDPNTANNGASATTTVVGPTTREWAVDRDGDWDDPSNWSTGAVPQSGDDVLIDRPGVNITVTRQAGDINLHSLISRERFVVAGGTVTLSGHSELAGVDIGPTATVVFASVEPSSIFGTVNNAGAINWTGSGIIALADGAHLK